MDDLGRLEAKNLARAKLRARRRRVRMIRSRSVVGAVALFVLAWAVVFAQLVSGADPVLSRTGRPAAAIQGGGRQERATPATADDEGAVEPAPEAELEFESEAEPEAEAEFLPEPEPEAEPEPVITSSS